MEPEHFPEEWHILLGIISNLHESCIDFDYSFQLKYSPGVRFNAHYDSKHRWDEFIVGVNLKSVAELYFTKKYTKTVSIKFHHVQFTFFRANQDINGDMELRKSKT